MRQDNFRAKCIYVAVMLRRMIDAILNKDAMDDKVIHSIPKLSEPFFFFFPKVISVVTRLFNFSVLPVQPVDQWSE